VTLVCGDALFLDGAESCLRSGFRASISGRTGRGAQGQRLKAIHVWVSCINVSGVEMARLDIVHEQHTGVGDLVSICGEVFGIRALFFRAKGFSGGVKEDFADRLRCGSLGGFSGSGRGWGRDGFGASDGGESAKVLAGDLESIEEGVGAALVEHTGGQGDDHIGDGELNGLGVVEDGEVERVVFAGDGVIRLGAGFAALTRVGVVIAEVIAFEGRRAALVSAGEDMAAFFIHRGLQVLSGSKKARFGQRASVRFLS